jgi:hypothetical protein
LQKKTYKHKLLSLQEGTPQSFFCVFFVCVYGADIAQQGSAGAHRLTHQKSNNASSPSFPSKKADRAQSLWGKNSRFSEQVKNQKKKKKSRIFDHKSTEMDLKL